MYKVVKKSEGKIRKIADNKIAVNYITKDVSESVSLAVTEATNYIEDQHAKYNRIYYVLEGTLVLAFGNETVELNRDDACFVSKGITYQMKGSFKAIIVNQPAFGT